MMPWTGIETKVFVIIGIQAKQKMGHCTAPSFPFLKARSGFINTFYERQEIGSTFALLYILFIMD